MAALERPMPSPEAFLGQPWTAWVREAALPHTHCAAAPHNVDLEETGKEGGKCREVMRLNKEDMHLFGHYPAHDDFYLVVCNTCNQVIKPQVFQSHCERRHSSMCKPSSSPASPLCNSKVSLIQMKSKSCISGHNPVNNSKPFKTPKDNLITSSSKQHMAFSSKVSRDNPWKLTSAENNYTMGRKNYWRLKKPLRYGDIIWKEQSIWWSVPVPVVSLEKIPNLVKADGANVKMNSAATTTIITSSASSSTIPAPIKSALTSKSVPPSPEKILNGKGVIVPSVDKKHQNGTKNSNKSYKRVSEREFDPNKHCGVLDPETKKPCTRSLTCKTHSLNHRRAVLGRKKQFDILLAEHKARSRDKEVTKDMEYPQTIRETHQSQTQSGPDALAGTSMNPGQEPKGSSPAKSRLPSSVFPRSSSTNSINSSTSSNHSGYVQELPLPAMGGDLPCRLSSDEGEGSEESEKLDCSYPGHRPRPFAFCSFGSHLMGRGYYVFDRRWDHFRLALNSMVEKHLNSQMWKKIPPAVDSPMPSPAAHLSTPFPASVLQPFSNPSSAYIPSTPVSSRIPSSYVMTSAMLSNATFVTMSDTNSITSHTTTFPHVAASLSILDSTFKTPTAMSPVPAVIPSPSHKPSKTKTSKSSKVRDILCRSDESSCNKKKKLPSSSSLSLQTSSSSSFSGSHRKNCVLNPSSTLNSYQATSSYNSMSMHNANNGTSPLSAKSEPLGRTLLSSTSVDSVKHMSIVVSSIDPSSLPVSSLVHHSGNHSLAAHNAVSSLPLCIDKSEGKKRKNSSSSSKACKITKTPGMNSIHKKNTANLISTVPDTPNSSISQPIGKNSGVALSQSSLSSTSNPMHNKQKILNRTGRIRTLP